jgi:tRNA(adenine34) deaminase
MHTDKYFINQAYKEALKALYIDEVPVGAIIVKDNKIIARAHNLKESLNLSTAHAEIIAINKASKKLKTWHLDDCIMYVTLEPCVMCAGAIIQSRIKKVVYGAKSYQDGAIESALKLYDTKGFNHYPETMYYDKNENCSKIITDYFKTKR